MLLRQIFRRRRTLVTAVLLTVFTVFLLCLGKTSNPNTSPLGGSAWTAGARLHRPSSSAVSARNFTILIWTHGRMLSRRFFRSFGTKDRDIFQYCAVRNCMVSTDNYALNSSDAVMFHLHRTRGPHTLPKTHFPHQVWIFFTDESPFHTFLETRNYSMKDYNGLFNWSMTYRSDADVPVPYGKIERLSAAETAAVGPLRNYAATKRRTVAIMGSNCGGNNFRWQYVKELSKHLTVDVYGGCGKLKCPGHFSADCPVLAEYKFYLAFENCNCREYITEKLWWNAYGKDSVPVVMGAFKEDYQRLCPPYSFIHVDDFEGPGVLAAYLRFLDGNDTAYNQYFAWKAKYRVINEHGYFGSPSLHMCRICEMLNGVRGRPTGAYTSLEKYWNSKTDCHPPRWKPPNKMKNA